MKYFIFAFHKVFFFIPAYIRSSMAFEFASLVGRTFTGRLKLNKQAKNYINLGSGHVRYDGFINVDFYYSKGIDYGADLRYPLRIDDNTTDAIVTEHTFEHLTYQSVDQLLGECHRILKPGGVIRIIVPDVSIFIREYAENNESWFKEWEKVMLTDSDDPERAKRIMPTKMHAISFVTQEYGHVACWDFDSMAYYLKKNGFTAIEKAGFKQGRNPELFIDLTTRDRTNVSLYIEASKSK